MRVSILLVVLPGGGELKIRREGDGDALAEIKGLIDDGEPFLAETVTGFRVLIVPKYVVAVLEEEIHHE